MEELAKRFAGKYLILNEETSPDMKTVNHQVFEISKETKERLDECSSVLYEFIFLERKVHEVKLNLFEINNGIENVVKSIELADSWRQVTDFQDLFYTDINRLLGNFTSSLKTLMDDVLVKNKMKKMLGAESEEFKTFKAKISEWYDHSFSYKFLIRLRDYMVHKDHAIKHINFDVEPVEKEGVNFTCTCQPMFVKEELLASDQFKSKLQLDLRGYNSSFPLVPILKAIEPIIDQVLPLILKVTSRYYDAAHCLGEQVGRFADPHSVSYGYVKVQDTENFLIQLDAIKLRTILYILDQKNAGG